MKMEEIKEIQDLVARRKNLLELINWCKDSFEDIEITVRGKTILHQKKHDYEHGGRMDLIIKTIRMQLMHEQRAQLKDINDRLNQLGFEE